MRTTPKIRGLNVDLSTLNAEGQNLKSTPPHLAPRKMAVSPYFSGELEEVF